MRKLKILIGLMGLVSLPLFAQENLDPATAAAREQYQQIVDANTQKTELKTQEQIQQTMQMVQKITPHQPPLAPPSRVFGTQPSTNATATQAPTTNPWEKPNPWANQQPSPYAQPAPNPWAPKQAPPAPVAPGTVTPSNIYAPPPVKVPSSAKTTSP